MPVNYLLVTSNGHLPNVNSSKLKQKRKNCIFHFIFSCHGSHLHEVYLQFSIFNVQTFCSRNCTNLHKDFGNILGHWWDSFSLIFCLLWGQKKNAVWVAHRRLAASYGLPPPAAPAARGEVAVLLVGTALTQTFYPVCVGSPYVHLSFLKWLLLSVTPGSKLQGYLLTGQGSAI